jgi:hypothetical protein
VPKNVKKMTRVKQRTQLSGVQDHSTHDGRFPAAPQSSDTFFFGDAEQRVECVFVAATLFYGQAAAIIKLIRNIAGNGRVIILTREPLPKIEKITGSCVKILYYNRNIKYRLLISTIMLL